MINVIKDLEHLKESNCYKIQDCEAFFLSRVTYKEFTEDDISVIQAIDKAVMLDISVGTIQTPFGVTDVNKLSTGCKSVLVYLYTRRHLDDKRFANGVLINVTECGYNALEVLFNLVDKLKDAKTVFLLCHNDGIGCCSGHKYLINNEIESEYPCA